MRRAKIVCTLGPASNSEEKLAALVEAGMNVARLNFSHGSHVDHATAIARIRRTARGENDMTVTATDAAADGVTRP